MGISILTEPISGGRFRAVAGAPFALEAEHDTREGAKERLMQIIESRICSGAKLETVEIESAGQHPVLKCVGDMKDDPWFDRWQEAIRDYRKEMEAAEAE